MRCFIAIAPPQDTCSKIGTLIDQLKSEFPLVTKSDLVKWEDESKVHITLAFLGILSPDKVNDLRHTLREVTKQFKAFELHIGKSSYFYKKHEDSIIYLDVEDRSKKLRNFYQALRRELLDKYISLPERLILHISIGRLKRRRHAHEAKQILTEIGRREIEPTGSFKVESINLYQSLYSKKNSSSNYRLLQSSHFAPTMDTDL